MALDLDTSSRGEDLKAESKRKRKLALIGIESAIGVSAAFLVISTVLATSNVSSKINQASVEYEAYKAEFESYKIEHPVVEKDTEKDSEKESGEETSKNIIEKSMISARNAGDEVSALQNLYFKDGSLSDADTKRLVSLTGSSEMWFGSKVDPSKVDIMWKMITPYDTTESKYNVLFACYTSDGKYLLQVRQATYYGINNDSENSEESEEVLGSFTISSTVLTTDYGKAILEGKTNINNQGSTETIEDILDIKDQLINEGVVSEDDDFDFNYQGSNSVSSDSDNDTYSESNSVAGNSDNNPGNEMTNDSNTEGSIIDPDDLGNEF